jgi:hypothetical protein
MNAGQPIDATAIGVYQALWEEGFEDLSYGVLEPAFKKTLRECKFWPVKVADVREHVSNTEEIAISQAAELEWQRVLDLRRRYFNPDMEGGFSRGMPKLSERVDRAARASGVFTIQNCEPEAIHVWAKKRFIESYVAWTELEHDQFLLPDGEIKNLLAGVAKAKQLARSRDEFQAARIAGEEYRERASQVSPAPPAKSSTTRRWRAEAYAALGEKETDPAAMEEVRRQKAALEARGFSVRGSEKVAER